MTSYFKMDPTNAGDASCNVITVEAFIDASATTALYSQGDLTFTTNAAVMIFNPGTE